MRRRSFLTLLASLPAGARAGDVALARRGQVLLPVVIAPGASPPIQRAARDLATYLGRITGQVPPVLTGDGTTGIAVGLARDFPILDVATGNTAGTAPEDYWLRSRDGGILVIGSSEAGVENAVWDFLHRLGYRHYFPGEQWEIVPRREDISMQLDVHGSPSYAARHIWYGYGPWDYAAEPYLQWRRHNRMPGAVGLRTGHAYGGIIRALQKEFDAHPEYYPLIDGVRRPSKNAKLCIGNTALRALVVQYALQQFRQGPVPDSVSMDPSDGGGWCECGDCAALGSISDRVVTLANEVAAAVQREFPGKLVGIYAYNFHSPPPSVRVHPKVVVSVATAFVRGGMTVDQIMVGWAKQGATLGVREYYSVNTWDRDLPGQARGGNIAYLVSSIPEFHRRGARFLSAESSDNWGPNGLGYYVAGRLLWDVREAARVDEIVDDFLARAFGAASAPMRDFYRLLDGSRPFLAGNDPVPGMFEALRKARELTRTDGAVTARLDALVLYAHYCALYRQYALASGEQRQAAFETLIRHAYRMRRTMMVHVKALYRDLSARDRTVAIPPGAEWSVPEGRNPWKSSRPFEPGEIESFVQQGARPGARAAGPVASVAFSDRLSPANWLRGPDPERGSWDAASGLQTFLVHLAQDDAVLAVRIEPSASTAAGWQGQVAISFEPVARAGGGAEGAPRGGVVQALQEPSGLAITLRGRSGLHRLVVSSGPERVSVRLPADVPVALASGPQNPMNDTHLDWHAYFYVPKGTRMLALAGGGHGEVQDGLRRTVFWLNGRARGTYLVPVPEGQDGKVWQVRHAEGAVTLLNVPPYFSPSPAQLLLPVDVVRSDAPA